MVLQQKLKWTVTLNIAVPAHHFIWSTTSGRVRRLKDWNESKLRQLTNWKNEKKKKGRRGGICQLLPFVLFYRGQKIPSQVIVGECVKASYLCSVSPLSPPQPFMPRKKNCGKAPESTELWRRAGWSSNGFMLTREHFSLQYTFYLGGREDAIQQKRT